jgi:hypothetical protein
LITLNSWMFVVAVYYLSVRVKVQVDHLWDL